METTPSATNPWLEKYNRREAMKRFTPGVDWVYSDGGQNAAGLLDMNNCTVRAYVNATGARFVDADAAMELCGRKRNKGSTIYCTIKRVSKMLGFGFIQQEAGTYRNETKVSEYSGNIYTYRHFKRMTVHTFLKQNPTGRFVITIKGHASAIVDGKVIDGHRWSKLCRLDGIYKVTEARAEWAA